MKLQALMRIFFGFTLFSLVFIVGCGDDTGGGSDELAVVFIDNASRLEGDDVTSTLSFTIRISAASTQDVSVSYETVDVDATAGEDYVATSGIANITAGETQTTVEVTVNGDTDYEEDEQFRLEISNPQNATISGTAALGTIRNDDAFVPTDDEGYSTPDNYPGLTLVWQDEFDGTSLNSADWNFEVGTGNSGWGNNELQSYSNGNNLTVSNGKLVIEAREEGGGYTSSRITTQGKQSFQYGRIDIRAKLPYGQGIWPALWMLGDNFGTDGWPTCGEIDIMELVGHEANKVHGTCHWNNNGSHASYGESYTLASGDFKDEFHVFTLVWDQSAIRCYVDDVQYYVIDVSSTGLSAFRANPFFFIFNVAVGGNWPGSPNSSTTFPQRMVVDYVRVFQ